MFQARRGCFFKRRRWCGSATLLFLVCLKARLIKSREEYAELTHLEIVTFGVTRDEIIRALNQPKAWPAIVGHIILMSFKKDKLN
ncbi:hypothetical protein DY000_02001845 [Brassica cretica]|uniref:Uncharacterized protein n=1 Tax=Brassica cretica TaxID=69181 RepID=A0ABQ7CAV2_BRACR|nr:hypothetical protein DY000_02001845 [Brassica cretica]